MSGGAFGAPDPLAALVAPMASTCSEPHNAPVLRPCAEDTARLLLFRAHDSRELGACALNGLIGIGSANSGSGEEKLQRLFF